jgi:hypothetical protein
LREAGEREEVSRGGAAVQPAILPTKKHSTLTGEREKGNREKKGS